MSRIIAGEVITDYITHLNNSGVLVPGATFTVITARRPDGSAFVPVISDLGGGSYRIQITTQSDQPGQWYLLIADNALTPPRYYDGSWDVDPAYAQTASGSTTGVTRTTLRRSIGRLVGDLTLCTATANGTTTTFIDTVNLVQGNDSLRGRQAYVSGATNSANIGLIRRVSGNVKATGTLTLAPALPAATVAGDVVELYNERDTGLLVEEIHDAINRGIRAVQGNTVHSAVSVIGAFDRDDPLLSIPLDWTYFVKAQWGDSTGDWRDVPHADLRVDQANREVEIRHRSRSLAHGSSVRLFGYAPPGTLSNDQDATLVDTEWLTYYAAAQVLIASAHRSNDTQALLSKATWFAGEADKIRGKTRVRPPGRFVRLR
jgi:hypothetical protein